MAVGPKAWSTTAASNGNADSNINFAENQAPSTVNDSARALMAAVKALLNSLAGNITYGGSSNAYTATNDGPNTWSTYAAPSLITLKANHTNTGAATINVDGLGAKTIKTADGGDLVAGDIVSGGIYLFAYDGTNFQILNTIAGGSYQPIDATVTAFAALSFDATNGFLRATAADTFIAEAAAAHKTALSLNNVDNTSDATKNAASASLSNKTFTTNPVVSKSDPGIDFTNTAIASLTWRNFVASDGKLYFTLVGTADEYTMSAASLSPVADNAKTLGDASHRWSDIKTVLVNGFTPANDASVVHTTGTESVGGAKTFGSALAATAGLAVTGADTTIVAAPSTLATNSAGLRALQYNAKNQDYTFVLGDSNSWVDHFSGSHTYTIPPNSSVAFPVGTIIYVVNATTLSIAEGSGVTLYRRDGNNATGTRGVITYGSVALIKATTNEWICVGLISS